MIGFSRRGFLGMSCCLATVAWQHRALAQSPYKPLDQLPPVPPEFQSLAGQEPMNNEFGTVLSQQGTSPPSAAEQQIADRIVAAVDALSQSRPVEVAGFLLEVARGTHGEDLRPFARAWPKDASANPLIVEFFRATKTNPVGDTTAWCAAFINWCILKGRKGAIGDTKAGGSGSAASGSFRQWGTEVATFDLETAKLLITQQPKVGDLCVFQEIRASGKPDPIHGHVAFFVDMDDSRVQVLGGNQFEGDPVVHAINVKWIPLAGSLSLHSIRTSPIL